MHMIRPSGDWKFHTCLPSVELGMYMQANIVLNTVRYAMIDQLTNPRPGFEEITRLHFRSIFMS